MHWRLERLATATMLRWETASLEESGGVVLVSSSRLGVMALLDGTTR